MKKNVLALSIAAMIGGLGFAGSASADVIVGTGGALNMTLSDATDLSLSEGGVGHSLVIPYFNAQNGNMTVLHVVNTDVDNGKAVKVRFRGAANSDDVLDFQVFMSPGDVWTAAVTQGANGVAQIVTADNTCTLPKLNPGVPQSFVTNRLNSKLTPDQIANNTREGYVEIFNMADIPKPTVLKDSLYEAIKHNNGVAPCTSAILEATLVNYTQADEADARLAGFDTPTGSLMGDWYIINVPQTTTFSGAATAVLATTAAGVKARGNFVHFPQSAVAAPTPDDFTADPLFRGVTPKIEAANYDLPDLSTPFVQVAGAAVTALDQAALLTKALSVKSVTNQYANDASITAKTDWVFSMPTRRYSVAANYAAARTAADPYRIFTDLSGTVAAGFVAGPPAVPGTNWFSATNTTVEGDLICVTSKSQVFYDREETTFKGSGAVFSPGTAAQAPRFCGETSVLSFADAGNSVLAASVARQNVSGAYANGWSMVDVSNTPNGLPILGASFIKLTNPNVGSGVSGTYGITWPHRFTK